MSFVSLSFVTALSVFFISFEVRAQNMRQIRLAADDVLSTLSPFLESEFDAILIANTATSGAASDPVPFQSARFLVKRDPQKALFLRDSSGKILGFNESNITTLEGLPTFLPISSGTRGDGGIRTFSGIFRVNHSKSQSGLSTSHEAPMSYAVYIDAHYGDKVSGVALHGTPTKNHHLLGVQRASHGCLRTFPKYAKLIYQYLIQNPALMSVQTPQFDRFQNLPDLSVQSGQLGSQKGVRALFVMFNGYDRAQASH